jgi:hypothetical protein
MNCQKRPLLNKFVKKDHPSVAARLARRHVARAAWAKDGKDMPPQPTPARCLPWPKWAMPALFQAACWRGSLPPLAVAAPPGACLQAATSHVTLPALALAAWPTSSRASKHAGFGDGGTPLPSLALGGLFWQIFSEVVLFDITLTQVVRCVKNSIWMASNNSLTKLLPFWPPFGLLPMLLLVAQV